MVDIPIPNCFEEKYFLFVCLFVERKRGEQGRGRRRERDNLKEAGFMLSMELKRN